ncbi:hypothetical protein BCR39DRAFT_60707 [Naematelia encephala]|uniref:BZIP domain-containing protein n=1 Tax=Naematelia encephala TaxID=71784 RepID=A0A1Y2BDL7_9TREE|nr:hypothetical protein BCR39DRAFT_60707 [Naematelia encephala]
MLRMTRFDPRQSLSQSFLPHVLMAPLDTLPPLDFAAQSAYPTPPLPTISLPLPAPYTMEPNWHFQGFYPYYPPDPARSASAQSDRPGAPPSPNHEDESGRRRAATQPGTFLPPPPPHTATAAPSSSGGMNLPPFNQAFYPPYHSSSGSAAQGFPPYPSHTFGNQGQGYAGHYPATSPATMSAPPLPSSHRQPHPHAYDLSPRMGGGAPYSSSPGMRNLSPTSPTTHLAPPGLTASSGSASSSSYPSAQRSSATLPKNKRRSGSASQSAESWDEGDRTGRDDDEQPWGMPQDEYKALNPRDKKQVRNRIGARRFRAKRKDYVANIETSLRVRDDEIASLKGQVEAHRTEINDLRSRLGLPALPPPPDAGLGLVVSHSSGNDSVAWDDRKD